LNAKKTLNEKASLMSEKNNELRKEADELIQNIWNEVEKYYSTLPAGIRREKCEEYGIIYYLRKGEFAEQNKTAENV